MGLTKDKLFELDRIYPDVSRQLTMPKIVKYFQDNKLLYQAASYVVDTDGTNCWCISGRTGKIEKYDTDAAIVLQYAIDNLPSDGGLVQFREGTFDFSSLTAETPHEYVFKVGTSGNTVDNIHIRGAGINATILKYTGSVGNNDGASLFLSSRYSVDAGTQNNVSVSDLTIDCNGLIEYGYHCARVTGFRIENVRVKNFNIFAATHAKCGLGIYSNYGVLRNIYIDPPMVTGDTNTTQSEILNTSLLFDSSDCHHVYAQNIYIDGNNVSIAKGGLSFEDHPHDIWVSNLHIRRMVDTAITSAANSTVNYNYHFRDVYIEDCGRAISMADKYDAVSFTNLYVKDITDTGTAGGALHFACDRVNFHHVELKDCPNVAGTWDAAIEFKNTIPKVQDITIDSSMAAGMRINSGTTKAYIDGAEVHTSGENGIEINNYGGGNKPTDTVITNSYIYNNNQEAGSFVGINDGATRTLIKNTIMVDSQGTATQKYGLTTNGTNCRYIDNYFNGNVTAAVNNAGGSPTFRNNVGWVTENSGTSSITSGTTSKTFNHGCSYTPAHSDVTITWSNGTTNDPGNWYVGTITSTQITVVVRNDPGASNANFQWAVRKV